MQRDHPSVVEQGKVLGGVQIQPEKAGTAEVACQITNILGRVLAAAGRVRGPVAPVELHKAAAPQEIGLPVDARGHVRTKLAVGGNVSAGVARADVDGEVGPDQSDTKFLERPKA